MKTRLSVALAVLALAGAAAPAAGATEVSVRVEGVSSTLLESTVDTQVHPVDGGDGTGSHVCRGPIGEAPGPTVTGALDDAVRAAGASWKGEWSSSSGDFLITGVAGEDATTSGPWAILLNGVPTPVGGCSMKVSEGDRVLFARDVVFQTMTLGLGGPTTVQPGRQFRLLVEDERNGGAPVTGAVVSAGELAATTGADGSAAFTLDQPGRYAFKATHPDGIRSNSVRVCIGTGGCVDNSGPAVRILGLDDGSRFMRAATPRNLSGRSRAGAVRIALTVKVKKRCRAWSPFRKKLIARRCGAPPLWVRTGTSGGTWKVPTGMLPPGRYRLRARAVGIPGQKWRKGVNRIEFEVLGRRLARKKFVRRSLGFLDRQTKTSTVRGSGLLAAWSGLALGIRDRGSAGRLLAVLSSSKPAGLGSGDLARNLAAANGIRTGRSGIRGLGRRLEVMRSELASRQLPDGSFESDPNLTAMAVLALGSGEPADAAAAWLVSGQDDAGGFSASGSGEGDVDTTGLVAWALARSDYRTEVSGAAAFVRASQNPDGGFPAVPGGRSNSQSTGLGLVAIHAAGGSTLGPRTADRITPVHFLATLQRRGGAIDYAPSLRTMPVWVTSQAMLGLTPVGRITGRGAFFP